MQSNIEAIFLDVGNTLRIVIEDKDFIAHSKRLLVELTGAQETPDAFHKKLEERYKVLRKRAKEKLIEASEKEMWTKWMLPDFPAEKIAPLSGKLTRLWRDCDGRRVPREEPLRSKPLRLKKKAGNSRNRSRATTCPCSRK